MKKLNALGVTEPSTVFVLKIRNVAFRKNRARALGR